MSVGSGSAITYDAPVNFAIAQSPPSGLPQDTVPAFTEVYNAIQQIIVALINNCGIGPQDPGTWGTIAGQPQTILHGNLGRFYVIASEAIAANALISLWSNGGVISVRNANATDGTRPCDGICSSPNGITVGIAGEVLLGPALANINGLIVGGRYYLATVNGEVTQVAPSGTGNVVQYAGVALSTTVLFVNPGTPPL